MAYPAAANPGLEICPCYDRGSTAPKSTRKTLERFNNSSKSAWAPSRSSHPPQQGLLTLGHFNEKLKILCQMGQLDQALDLLSCMEQHGHAPSQSLCWSLLKLCNKKKALHHAVHLHAHLALHGLDSTSSLGEYLVITLAKCSSLDIALQVFYKLPHRTVFSWTAVISGYSNCGKAREALALYDCMLVDDVEPNKYTFISLLKACGDIPDIGEGKRLHAEASKHMCTSDLYVAACLLDMFAKCGSLVDAQDVFDSMAHRDVVLWTAMLSAYIEWGHGEKALQLYRRMQAEGVSPDGRTYVSALQACCILAEKEEAVLVDEVPTKVMSLKLGQEIHKDAKKKGFGSDVFVCSTLVNMYSKCGNIGLAHDVFHTLSQPDVVSWTALISAYVEHGQGQKALELYQKMHKDGETPNQQTFVIALQACCTLAEEDEEAVLVKGQSEKGIVVKAGRELHVDASKKGFDSDVYVGSALVSMYGMCGNIVEAEKVFDTLFEQDVVAWTAMLSAYVVNGQGEKALLFYRQLEEAGVNPNERTVVIALQACGTNAVEEEATTIGGQSIKVLSLKFSQDMHAAACMKGFDLDLFVSSTLVSVYGKCGSIPEAENVFGWLPQRTVVTWILMLLVYVEHGEGEKASQLYKQMQMEGLILEDTTLMCILQACNKTGIMDICRQIHFSIVSARIDSDLLQNGLIHAYGSCASMADAQAVFDATPQGNVVSWTALIAGYARAGNCTASLQTFEKMQLLSIKPNAVTLLAFLSACSQAGLVDEGVEYFRSMNRDYGITPEVEHYGSVLDLLGRTGDFSRVKDMLSGMTRQPDLAIWLSLLGSCHKHGNVELGRQVFDHAVQLQPEQGAVYVLMSNIYADAGLWDCVKEVETIKENRSSWAKPCWHPELDHA